jgi:hypothetical protein
MNNFTFKGTLLCIIITCFSPSVQSQQTLTQINSWNAYVHLPANYNSTTATYPAIIFFPGLGEVGTTASRVIAHGPGAYIAQGWDGSVMIDGNKVEFIVISLQPPAAYPNEVAINQRIQTIKSLYRINPNKLYLTGLSHGGWCANTFVTGDAYGGPYTYASQIAAVTEVQGVIPDDNSPYPNLFDNYAASGGKLLGFEQRLDYRGVEGRVNRMNATAANSAIYQQTNFGGGGHCCWNQFYGGQGVQPGNFMLGGISQNLYQWMGRQSRGGGTLPVSISNFSGSKQTDGNMLRWTTETEINNEGFEIQRSTDGVNFKPIGFVNSLATGGNSTTSLSYTFMDKNISSSWYYYRLLQKDLDNKSKLSSVVRIKGDNATSIKIEAIFPNPASGTANVIIASPVKEKVTIVVTDIAGRTMMQQVAGIEEGSNTVPLTIARLSNGTYVVKVVSDNQYENVSEPGAQVLVVK